MPFTDADNAALFRGVLESAPDAMIIADGSGTILQVNAQAERLFGYTRAELVHQPVELLMPFGFRARHAAYRDGYFGAPHVRAIGTGPDLCGVRKNGEELAVEISLSPLRVEGGVLVIAAIRDVTDRRRAERELQEKTVQIELARVLQARATELEREVAERRQAQEARAESERRLQFALEVAQIGHWEIDLPTGSARGSLRHARIFGYDTPQENWTFDRFVDHVVPDDRASVRDQFRHAVDARREWRFDCRIQRTDGEIRWISAAGRPQSDDGGRLRRLAGTVQDITEHKQTADALRRTEERMRFALEAAGVGIWGIDYATGRLEWSVVSEAHYGYAPGTFPGTFDAFIARVHPDDRPATLDVVERSLRAGGDFTVAHRALWPDGTVRWLNGAGRILLGADGRPTRGVGISTDVTEKHALEAQYLQAQKMEAVGRLAGGVAHDFNNLLTAILGYTGLALATLEPESGLRPDLEEVVRAARSAASLTRQLLIFSRKDVSQPVTLRLSDIVARLKDILQRLIGEHITFAVTSPPGTGFVQADASQLEQVLMNLVVNANDAMPGGGTLSIGTDTQVVTEAAARAAGGSGAGAYEVLTVRDTGAGMTPEVQAQIFEPFFTTKGPEKGTGLGLATVHGIVRQAGGFITVESAVGQGSSFSVFLPRVAESAEIASADEADAVPRGSETVLFVEDNDRIRAMAARFLEKHGYAVLTARDATEALAHADRALRPPDLVITDIVMPGMNGRALADRLRRHHPGMKVVFTSGFTDDLELLEGIRAGDTPFLQKPYSMDVLARTVRRILDA